MSVKLINQIIKQLFTGAVTQVKDQGVCGSCWSFGTVGTIEGAYFLKTGRRERFSQQQLIDCSWGEGNNGCDGGEDFRSVLKGHCLIFLSAIYQLFIEYFNIK